MSYYANNSCKQEQKMQYFGRLFVLGALFLTISACTPTVAKPRWVFEKQAVKIHVKASNDLNMYNGRPHTLYICTYQLTNFNTFDRLARDPDGIHRLLECRLFDQSVASTNSKVIHAGEHVTLILDRAEQAQHLAVVAGYSAGLTSERVVRRHTFQTGKHLIRMLQQEYRCIPCELNIELSLGPHQIEYSNIIPNEPVCHDECEQTTY